MNNPLPEKLTHTLKSAEGLAEPVFDEGMQILNWPPNVTIEIAELLQLLQTSANTSDLRTCANILNGADSFVVPKGFLQLLSRALFDNPNTPIE